MKTKKSRIENSRFGNMRIMRGKKAVSPLIATVLLIAFAIALGAVVMNWGSDYVKKTVKSTGEKSDVDIKCSTDTYLRIISIGGTPQLCLRNSTTPERVEFTIENGPNTRLEGIVVTVIGNLSINKTTIVQTIAKSEAVKLNVSYDTATFGIIKQVRFAPQMKVEEIKDSITCSKNALAHEDIYVCS